jgi:hypothetical protein
MSENVQHGILETHKRRSLTSTPRVAEPLGAAGITAAVASLVAGLAHYAASGTHLPAETVAAVLFTVVGGFQLVWPALLRPHRRSVLLAGLAVNAAAVVMWALSRTVGLPFGHHAGAAQQVGLLDAAAVAAEVVVVVAGIALLRHHQQRDPAAK